MTLATGHFCEEKAVGISRLNRAIKITFVCLLTHAALLFVVTSFGLVENGINFLKFLELALL